nr:hypothetical protein [Tabrizicola soli]
MNGPMGACRRKCSPSIRFNSRSFVQSFRSCGVISDRSFRARCRVIG